MALWIMDHGIFMLLLLWGWHGPVFENGHCGQRMWLESDIRRGYSYDKSWAHKIKADGKKARYDLASIDR